MQTKFCVITMQYGFVGMLSTPDGGFLNLARTQTRSNQFTLNDDTAVSSQIHAELKKMMDLAEKLHDKEYPESKGYGHILSHSVSVIDS